MIELLVVILIIGILAGIAIPIFLSQRQKGADAAAKSDIRAGVLAEETYFLDHGTYADIATVGAEENLKVSKGSSVVSVFVDPKRGYCLGSINAGGSPLPASQASLTGISASVVWWYDSGAGGLQPRNAAISQSNYGCPKTNAEVGATFAYATVIG